MADEKRSEPQVYLIEGRAATECLRVLRQIDARLKRDGLPAFFPDESGAEGQRGNGVAARPNVGAGSPDGPQD